jgi:hypothetical protein
MKLNPTTVVTMEDWLVDLFDSKGKRRRIGVSGTCETEERAVALAMQSVKQADPSKVCGVRRRRQDWIDKSTTQNPALVARFVET